MSRRRSLSLEPSPPSARPAAQKGLTALVSLALVAGWLLAWLRERSRP